MAGYDVVERYADLLEEQHELVERMRGVMDAAPERQRVRLERLVELRRYCRPTQDDLRQAVAAPDGQAGALYAMRAHLRVTDGHLAHLPDQGDLGQIDDEPAREELLDLGRRLLQNRAELAECVDVTTTGTSGPATVEELSLIHI